MLITIVIVILITFDFLKIIVFFLIFMIDDCNSTKSNKTTIFCGSQHFHFFNDVPTKLYLVVFSSPPTILLVKQRIS